MKVSRIHENKETLGNCLKSGLKLIKLLSTYLTAYEATDDLLCETTKRIKRLIMSTCSIENFEIGQGKRINSEKSDDNGQCQNYVSAHATS